MRSVSSPQRSDQIEMFNIPFDRQELQIEQEQLDTMYQRDFYWDIGKKVGLVLLALFAFFYLKEKVQESYSALGSMMPAPRPHPSTARASTAIQDEEEPSAIVIEKRKPRLVDHMQQTAKERPDEVAKVIKTLMIE